MSHNIWEDLMEAREKHMEWIGDTALNAHLETNLPLVVLGRSFKPETNIETGSPAILMANIMREKGFNVDNVEDKEDLDKAIYVIGTQHQRYTDYKFPAGSIVYDPFGIIKDQSGVIVNRLGRI